VAWFALAAGLYAIAVFVRQPASRALLPIWAGGQCLAALSYVALFFLVVRPVAENTDAPGLIATYLKGAFPQPGQNPIVFFLIGAAKQLINIAGGAAGAIILGLFGSVGLAAWYRSGDSRWVMVTGIYLTAIGAYAKFFPFGMSRHSVLIGLLSLAAAGAGIDALGQVWRGARVAVTRSRSSTPSPTSITLILISGKKIAGSALGCWWTKRSPLVRRCWRTAKRPIC